MRTKLILLALFVSTAALFANPFIVGLVGDGATGGATPPPGGGGTQCADVVFSPASSLSASTTVTLITATVGATIFYRSSTAGRDPVHAGAIPTSPTKTYTGPFSSGVSTVAIRAVAYKSGLSDSNVTEGDYGP